MSKIKAHPSLVVARKVVGALEKIVPKDIAKDCIVRSWSNCREQGLSIEHWQGIDTHKAVVSEARSSDDILVVTGSNYDFDFQTNQPTDEAWEKNRRYFKYESYGEVAKHILNFFKKHIDK